MKMCPFFYEIDAIMMNRANINPLALSENMDAEQVISDDVSDAEDEEYEEEADNNSQKSDESVEQSEKMPPRSSSSTKRKRPMSIARGRSIPGKARRTRGASSNAIDLVSDVTGSLKALGDVKQSNYDVKLQELNQRKDEKAKEFEFCEREKAKEFELCEREIVAY